MPQTRLNVLLWSFSRGGSIYFLTVLDILIFILTNAFKSICHMPQTRLNVLLWSFSRGGSIYFLTVLDILIFILTNAFKSIMPHATDTSERAAVVFLAGW